MRQILLLISVLLLGLTWAIAQDASQTTPSTSSGQSSTSAGQTSSGQTSSHHMGRSSAGETTVEGCLSGSSGNYTLTDKNGNTYQLTGDTAKLSEHVGHEVKIMGSTSAGAGSTSSGAAAGSSAGAGSQQTLQVSSVKHVSKTCKSGAGMSH